MKHYINAYFHIKDNIVIKPYQYNYLFYKYLKDNQINSYAIITAFNSNINDYKYNSQFNISLENEINGYEYHFCYGADGFPYYNYKEDSFFIKNISFEHSIILCKKYKQDCILYGENELGKLYDYSGNIIT
jgi:hypothetical protein